MIFPQSSKPDDVGTFLKEQIDLNDVQNAHPQIERSGCVFQSNTDRFSIKDRNFGRQYAHLYAERLLTMRKRVSEAAHKKWGTKFPVRKLHELKSDEKCIIIGTLFKHMELKPSILKEISEEHNLMPQPIRSRYTDASDKLIMEDELQRIVLVGDLKCETSVTGIIVAVLGKEPEDDKGKFYVEEHCFQQLPAQVPRPTLEQDKYILFVSGFELGGKDERPFQMQLLSDLVTGQLGDPGQQAMAASICHVIIAGNSLSADTQDRDTLSKAKYLSKKTSAGSLEGMKSMDNYLLQLVSCVDVSLVPGEYDPSNYTLPQQALHRCMFPKSYGSSTLHCHTNPCDLTLDGVRILGSAGQPVDDIARYSDMDDHLEILEHTLEWGHLAPTAPDTLGCYPFVKEDPFILSESPHIYFAGCQPEFKSKIYKGGDGQEVLLLTIPRFSQTGTSVLVNMNTLQAQPISFYGHFPIKDESVSPVVDK